MKTVIFKKDKVGVPRVIVTMILRLVFSVDVGRGNPVSKLRSHWPHKSFNFYISFYLW